MSRIACTTMAEYDEAYDHWKRGLRHPDSRPYYDPPACQKCGGMVFEPNLLPAFIPIPKGICMCVIEAPIGRCLHCHVPLNGKQRQGGRMCNQCLDADYTPPETVYTVQSTELGHVIAKVLLMSRAVCEREANLNAKEKPEERTQARLSWRQQKETLRVAIEELVIALSSGTRP